MKKSIILIPFLLLVATSCTSNPAPGKKTEKRPVNYIILLDLSDRLLCQNQSERDRAIISAVFKEFDSQVRKNLVINSNDKFQIVISKQKGASYNTRQFENELFIDMGSLNPGNKIGALTDFSKELSLRLTELYTAACVGKKPSDYQGAAIWQFFNENLEYITGSKYENCLVVLTDGYFDLEDYGHQLPSGNRFPTTSFLSAVRDDTSWKEKLEKSDIGLLPVKKEFNNLKVIVMGINPKYDFQYENDMLIYVWEKWCREMNISAFSAIPQASLPQSLSVLRDKIENSGSNL